jgi:hypothetical protein
LLLRVADRPSWTRCVSAGVMLGITAYLRSEWLFFVPFAALAVLAVRREHVAVLPVAAMCLAALLAVSPWLVRNQQLGAGPIMSASTGIVLWEGLGEFPNPWGAVPDDVSVAIEMRTLGISDPLTANAFYTKRVFSSILHDPLVYASEVVRRLPHALFVKTDWGLAEMNTRYPGFQELNAGGRSVGVLEFFRLNPVVFLAKVVPWMFDILLFGLAAVGLIASARRDPRTWIVASPAIFAIALYSLTHFEARYLVPALVSYPLFASIGTHAVLRWSTRRLGIGRLQAIAH